MEQDLEGAAERVVRQQLQAMVRAGGSPGLQYLFVAPGRPHLQVQAGVADPRAAQALEAGQGFNLYSLTKLWTAAAVLACVQRGLVALDEPLQRYLPAHAELGEATLRQTLLHTAGFANPNPLSWVHLLRDSFDEARAARQLLVEHGRPVRSPGGAYRYSNIGYLWLGEVLRAVTAQPLPAWLQQQGLLGGAAAAPGEWLGFERPDPARLARGALRRWGWLNPLLGLMLDRDRFVAGASRDWICLEPHQVDGLAYGGLIGNAAGVAAGLQRLLARDGLRSSGCPQGLFESMPMVGPGRSLGGFTGWLDGAHWCGHPGGGLGYYSELRVYPRLGAISVLLLNRAGLRDEGLLGRLDRPLILELLRRQAGT